MNSTRKKNLNEKKKKEWEEKEKQEAHDVEIALTKSTSEFIRNLDLNNCWIVENREGVRVDGGYVVFLDSDSHNFIIWDLEYNEYYWCSDKRNVSKTVTYHRNLLKGG